MCKMGATDMELARAFDVSFGVIKQWQVKYEQFADACRVGQDYADNKVRRALYLRSVGYEYDAVKILSTKEGIVETPYIEHVPPDIGAIKYWLNNRQPEEWAERSRSEVTGKNGKDLVPPAAMVDLASLPDELLYALQAHMANDANSDA